MKKILVVLTAAAAFAGLPSFALAAPAAGPQATAAVHAVLEAMEVRKMMAATFSEMEKQIPGMMRAQVQAQVQADNRLSAEQKKEALAKADAMIPKLTQAIHGLFTDPAVFDEAIAAMVPLYASTFTVAELEELAVFYRTPLGRKLLVTAPRLSAEGMAVGQKIMMPRLGKVVQDMMQGVQKQ